MSWILKSGSSNTEKGRIPEMEAADMTNEQKRRIAQMKAEGKSYGDLFHAFHSSLALAELTLAK